ncbi:MAG TPA: hypothetical protein VK619_00425 [Pyrinomonadaceae bacterium]|nr:hypothetical protein [Pyrinomonadaceae bacterium]
MFTRQLTMKLKPNTTPELTRAMESAIIPTLRKQKGFLNEITFISPERSEAVASSIWDTKENADAYNHSTYPEVLKTLSNVLDGNPRVQTFEICNSTFPKVAAQTV